MKAIKFFRWLILSWFIIYFAAVLLSIVLAVLIHVNN